MKTDDIIKKRNGEYGYIGDNDRTVIQLFEMRTGIALPKGSYPVFMQCVKVMREFFKHSEDNILDLGAYKKLEEILEKKPVSIACYDGHAKSLIMAMKEEEQKLEDQRVRTSAVQLRVKQILKEQLNEKS